MFTSKVVVLLALSLFAGANSQELITEDSYFFGQSEPVYPSPTISAAGGLWADALNKAQAFVAQLTLEEKTNLTGGVRNPANGCGGNIAGIPRLGFPGLCLADAGNGVRATDLVNAYSSGIHDGASWNKNLTYARAYQLGGEFRRKGVNVALGPPMIGPVGRIALGGRNWEGFSNDPYHSGILAGLSVTGIQDQGVVACTKHFIGNEQETARNQIRDASNVTILSSSANIDDSTMHELYLWPFYDAVHAGTGSIMCSYTRLNNSYACQNSKMLNGVLKGELGYQGFVVSDWGAQHGGVASALAGMDMVMPSGAAFSLGIGMPANPLLPHTLVDARVEEARPVLMQSAIEGHVLVKNTNNALPLKKPRVLSLFGYDAVAPDLNTPGFREWSLSLQSSYARFYDCGYGNLIPQNCPLPVAIAANGTVITGGGSGGATASYISAPFNAIQNRAMKDNTQLYWDFRNLNATGFVQGESDAALVFINAIASEGADRPALRDDFSDALVRNIASQNNNTIVVIHNAGIRLVDQWIENPNVTAVIFAHLPGQDSGEALVKILYGDVSPSGKLPYTVAKNETDYGAILNPVIDLGENGEFYRFPQDNFTEGVYIDYRAFDASNIEPRFEFGFGLTYSNFSFSGLTANSVGANLSALPTGHIVPGGKADLWDVVATVTATVTNIGKVAAQQVTQLYIGIPQEGQPVRQLRGFEKIMIHPNATATVEFELRRRDLSVWDVTAQEWRLVLAMAVIK
ncbi:putative beta-glucosidase M [Glarea lozoyensis 74030]|uniref:beta-glucosidase n=1 Tax=Glarea lozoyensis (strain ATCC 74030 / MF5533) TaxID=1104152 RepID=H0EHB7_GLAL7|nr:putative beta-glucosidase M [Glarea lozoyensis 74030]